MQALRGREGWGNEGLVFWGIGWDPCAEGRAWALGGSLDTPSIIPCKALTLPRRLYYYSYFIEAG